MDAQGTGEFSRYPAHASIHHRGQARTGGGGDRHEQATKCLTLALGSAALAAALVMWLPAPAAGSSIEKHSRGLVVLLRGAESSPVGADKVDEWWEIWRHVASRLTQLSEWTETGTAGNR